MSSPTSRTLKLLKEENRISEVVERWNAFTNQRKDLFGFIDLISLDVNKKEIWGIQCTSTGNISARVKKIKTECLVFALNWINAGGRIEVIGWSKKGAKGKRKLWKPTRRIITMDDLK